jgi:hypothetical protein
LDLVISLLTLHDASCSLGVVPVLRIVFLLSVIMSDSSTSSHSKFSDDLLSVAKQFQAKLDLMASRASSSSSSSSSDPMDSLSVNPTWKSILTSSQASQLTSKQLQSAFDVLAGLPSQNFSSSSSSSSNDSTHSDTSDGYQPSGDIVPLQLEDWDTNRSTSDAGESHNEHGPDNNDQHDLGGLQQSHGLAFIYLYFKT